MILEMRSVSGRFLSKSQSWLEYASKMPCAREARSGPLEAV